MEIGIVGCTWLGDNLMASSVLKVFHQAWKEEVQIYLPPSQVALFQKLGDLPAYPLPKKARERIALYRALDTLILLSNSFRTAWEAFLAKVPQRIGYDTDNRGVLLTLPLAPSWDRHQMMDYHPLLRALSLPLPKPGYSLRKPPGKKPPGEVALYVGGTNTPTKRWLPERFHRLAKYLKEAGFQPYLLAGPGEKSLAYQVSEQLPLLGPTLGLVDLAGYLVGTSLVVGNDSGLLHLASAVGTPTIALFGPTDPSRTAPWGSRVLSRQPSCSPCFLQTCPNHHACMHALGSYEVFQVCLSFLT